MTIQRDYEQLLREAQQQPGIAEVLELMSVVNVQTESYGAIDYEPQLFVGAGSSSGACDEA